MIMPQYRYVFLPLGRNRLGTFSSCPFSPFPYVKVKVDKPDHLLDPSSGIFYTFYIYSPKGILLTKGNNFTFSQSEKQNRDTCGAYLPTTLLSASGVLNP